MSKRKSIAITQENPVVDYQEGVMHVFRVMRTHASEAPATRFVTDAMLSTGLAEYWTSDIEVDLRPVLEAVFLAMLRSASEPREVASDCLRRLCSRLSQAASRDIMTKRQWAR